MQTILNSIQFKEILDSFLAFFITKQSNILHFLNSSLTLTFLGSEKTVSHPFRIRLEPQQNSRDKN